jgi:flavin reductase (DIM6/NTAB) family NADH-FMN oxidoreductase RutF
MLLVCMNLRGSTQRAIQESRKFGVNILGEDQGYIAERFGHPGKSVLPG